MFYIFGLVGIVWFILLMILTSDSPQNHKFISENERDYIIESIGGESNSSSNSKYSELNKYVSRLNGSFFFL